MRVLQLGKYYYPYMGGIETHLKILCDEIRDQVELEVIVCNSAPGNRYEALGGVPVTRCSEVANQNSVSICPTMPLELSLRSYDLVHFHFPHPMGVMAYLSSRRPKHHSVIVTYHSDIVKQKHLARLYGPFMDRVLDRAAAIICTSPDYIESSSTLNRFRDKCHVIPYGIDLAQFDRTSQIDEEVARIKQKFQKPILLGCGRLIYYKGFEFAIRGMQDLDAELLLVGDGPLRPDLEKLARECGVADKVHFLGEVHNHDLAPYYYAADIFVFPSVARSEAFGIVQLEAMACGTAVLNTRLASGVPFVSRHGESGFTIEPESPGAFSRGVRDLLSDRERLERFGRAGRARVERDFTKGVMAGRILDLYKRFQPSL